MFTKILIYSMLSIPLIMLSVQGSFFEGSQESFWEGSQESFFKSTEDVEQVVEGVLDNSDFEDWYVSTIPNDWTAYSQDTGIIQENNGRLELRTDATDISVGVSQFTKLTDGQEYDIEIKVDSVDGNLVLVIGGDTLPQITNIPSGTSNYTVTAEGTSTFLAIYEDASVTAIIDYVTITPSDS